MGTLLRYPARQTELSDQTLLETGAVVPHEWVAGLNLMEKATEPTVTTYRVSRALEEAFDRVLQELGHGLGGSIVSNAKAAGYSVYLIGGCVRNLLLGRTDIIDLDLTGDMPSALFRDVAYLSAIEQLPRERSRLREAWLPQLTISQTSGAVSGYRILPTTPQQRRSGRDWIVTKQFLEYSPFKQMLMSSSSEEFAYGWDPEIDAVWRDLTINSLMYDPIRRTILDPLGALDDYGLSQGAIRDWSGETADLSRVVLRPLPIPNEAPAMWAPKAIARVIKSMLRHPGAVLSEVLDWVEENHQHLQPLQADPRQLRALLASSLDVRDEGGALYRKAKPAIDAIAESSTPPWFSDLLLRAAPPAPTGRGAAAATTTPVPANPQWRSEASSAVNLVPGASGFQIGSPVPNPAEGDPSMAANYLSQQFAGWTRADVELQGVDSPVEAFTDGTRYVVGVDGTGRILEKRRRDRSL